MSISSCGAPTCGPASNDVSKKSSPLVVIVDDNEDILELEMLRIGQLGYDVRGYSSPEGARGN